MPREIEVVDNVIPDFDNECYEYMGKTYRRHGESTYYTTDNNPLYVGRLVKDSPYFNFFYFEDEKGKVRMIGSPGNGGGLWFRKVPCRPANIPSLQELSRDVIYKNYNVSELPKDDSLRRIIDNNYKGGKSRRKRRSKRRTRRRKTKRRA
jgi:hypothetical protein